MKLEVLMSQSVTIKSNKYGINLILSPEATFDELLEAIIEKFKASANFFKNAKLAISFEGRQLSDDEQQQIIAAIEENTTIEILCVVESCFNNFKANKKGGNAFTPYCPIN